jgi:hypothetical protein
MSPIEERILKNQIEILWAINRTLGKMFPELVGCGGELDGMRDDLSKAANDTKTLIEKT